MCELQISRNISKQINPRNCLETKRANFHFVHAKGGKDPVKKAISTKVDVTSNYLSKKLLPTSDNFLVWDAKDLLNSFSA